jgi:23S rRNA pseudouridine2605 synthase
MNKIEPTEKLQKILAQTGLGSRREIEKWIEAGRVKVNGSIAKIGDRATVADRIMVDDKLVKINYLQEKPRLLLYHKPAGEICSRKDPEGRPTVFDHLPRLKTGRWISIGRLDISTSGLLLFTNDGNLANRLMHPSADIEREYAVRVFGTVSQETLARLKKGVRLEDGLARFESVASAGGDGSNTWYHVILKEGRYREVRRLFESQNLKVSRLIRVRFGPIFLPRDLRFGCWVEAPPDAYFAPLPRGREA